MLQLNITFKQVPMSHCWSFVPCTSGSVLRRVCHSGWCVAGIIVELSGGCHTDMPHLGDSPDLQGDGYDV